MIIDSFGLSQIENGGTGAKTAENARKNLEVMKAYILYDNSEGTTGTVTLSDSAANYKFMDIIFGNGTGKVSVTLYKPDKTNVVAVSGTYSSVNAMIYGHYASVNVNGTIIYWYVNVELHSINGDAYPLNGHAIYSVIGYK